MRTVIKNMPIDRLNDIVIVCVISHGASDSESQYPVIRFGEDDKLPYETIMNTILLKEPAYLLSIVTACNGKTNEIISSPYSFQNLSFEGRKVKLSVWVLEI